MSNAMATDAVYFSIWFVLLFSRLGKL